MKLLRITAVCEQLGMAAATLRAWERRYGVPSPSRTASAYRLYGEVDVEVVRTMRDLVASGVAPAEAARQVLAAKPERAPAPDEHDPYAVASDRIVAATAAFRPDDLALEMARAATLGPAVSIFERAIGPALERIGDLWHDGEITIAHEHLASHAIGAALGDLVRLAQPAERARTVALACFADEDHQLGLYGVALRFASWGFRTVMLGARTPAAALGRAVETLAPDAVALSTTIPPEASRARELVDAYADACRRTVWIVGGKASERVRPWVEARGGILAAEDPSELRRQVDRTTRQRRHAEDTRR